ncbi:hypothetical protein [Marinomonas mediterranea]|uniref:hypothetical protein n=1 Tax=Marinomonas mediterranea TaxID=119864 RepID=UPI0023496C18|nr:hypothetical protein [Marinomonas mediterranea]
MASPLSDLDELVLKCRDEKAKSYIKEAVSCYKSGAFRSAIVSTWVAVSFDIIDKIRELSLAGDKEAEVQLKAFEKARDEGDISHSLKFEREMLMVCRDKLELISHLEFIDLARLQEDRNRCAHPSMTSDSQIFNPSAELARVHIRSAVEYLLQYPPVQGKSAMDILLKEVDSDYFPTNMDKALIVFKSSPLIKARESLVRNFLVVLLKKLLEINLDFSRMSKLIAAIKSVEELYKDIYNAVLEHKISSIFRSVDDKDLDVVFYVLRYFPDYWCFLDDAMRQKLNSYVLVKININHMDFLLNFEVLRKSALYRLDKVTIEELAKSKFFLMPEEVADKTIEFYVNSSSFEDSNKIAPILQRHSIEFSYDQIKKIMKGYKENSQIYSSHSVIGLLNCLRSNEKVNVEEFNSLINE